MINDYLIIKQFLRGDIAYLDLTLNQVVIFSFTFALWFVLLIMCAIYVQEKIISVRKKE